MSQSAPDDRVVSKGHQSVALAGYAGVSTRAKPACAGRATTDPTRSALEALRQTLWAEVLLAPDVIDAASFAEAYI